MKVEVSKLINPKKLLGMYCQIKYGPLAGTRHEIVGVSVNFSKTTCMLVAVDVILEGEEEIFQHDEVEIIF